MSQPVGNASYRQHLEAASRQTGVVYSDLIEPFFPSVIDYVWEWYQELRPRVGTGFSPADLTWAEIESWCRLTGARATPFEVRLLHRLHGVYLAAWSKAQAKSKSGTDQ